MIAVGVDAGGTATVAAVTQAGEPVGRATGPAANATTAGVEDAARTIAATARRALGGHEPDSLYAGVAGAGRPTVAAGVSAALAGAFPNARVLVGDDTAIALRAAIPSGPGIVLIAGTGSSARARARRPRPARRNQRPRGACDGRAGSRGSA
jgi:N-acetylglucosamine kinase-like BadF-type ATPase